jgi:hypothetical protein
VDVEKHKADLSGRQQEAGVRLGLEIGKARDAAEMQRQSAQQNSEQPKQQED